MSATWDVVIIGSGVIGLTTAHTLARSGLSVAILDSGNLGRQASWAGAGIIPPGDSLKAQTPLEHFRGISSNLFPDLSQYLLDQTGIDNGYRICGGLELISSRADLDSDEYRGSGIECHQIEGSHLRELEQGLDPRWTHAYWIPRLGQIRNPRHLQALIASCQKLGVQLEPHTPVRALHEHNGSITSIETDKERFQAKFYLLSAGAWSQSLLQLLGWDLGIWPVQGQMALLKTGRSGIRPLVLAGKRYLVPREDGLVLVGSTEDHVGFDTSTTEAGITGLLDFAYSVLPELRMAHLQQSWAGLRPGSRDGLPTIGWVPGCDNLLVAAGHYRVGLQLSPATALIIKQLILGQPTALNLNPFRLDRLSSEVNSGSIP